MANVLFVSEQKIKAFTQMHGNIQMAHLTPSIIQAQDVYLQPLLGTSFYRDLRSKIVDDSLSTEEKELINDFIAPAVMNRALYSMLPFIKYKISQKGLLSGESENSSATDLNDLEFLMSKVLDTAQFYETRVTDWLCLNSAQFPKWNVQDEPGDMKSNKSTSYDSGLAMPRRKYRKIWKKNCDY